MNAGSPSKTKAETRTGAPRRSAARMAAVQALYQIEMSDDSMEDVVQQFLERPEGELDAPDGATPVPPKTELFTEIVRGVRVRLKEIDDHLVSALSEGWPVGRVEPILRSILRAGIYELRRPDAAPARVVIDEYVDLAHAFYGGAEPGMVNGVLDKLARALRPDEFEGGGAGKESRDPSVPAG